MQLFKLRKITAQKANFWISSSYSGKYQKIGTKIYHCHRLFRKNASGIGYDIPHVAFHMLLKLNPNEYIDAFILV